MATNCKNCNKKIEVDVDGYLPEIYEILGTEKDYVIQHDLCTDCDLKELLAIGLHEDDSIFTTEGFLSLDEISELDIVASL